MNSTNQTQIFSNSTALTLESRSGSCHNVWAIFGASWCNAQDNTAGGDVAADQRFGTPIIGIIIGVCVLVFILFVVWALRKSCVLRPPREAHGNRVSFKPVRNV
nr:MAG: hypothetical protein [Seabass toti-like virus]WHL55070.1 MAG: hypothetical protein [Seabass toti-like virus]WHL55088.1 MAG: hypothetical protein [Seabass toti-like virus]